MSERERRGGSKPKPLSPSARPASVDRMDVCRDSESLRRQPNLGDTPPLLAQESRARRWEGGRGRGRTKPTSQSDATSRVLAKTKRPIALFNRPTTVFFGDRLFQI